MKIITQCKCCLGSNKRINGDILFLVRHLMPRSCLMWDRDNTPENTGAFEVLLYHTPPSNWCSSIIIPQAAEENNFSSRWDKVCILRHMHPGSWLNVESIWDSYSFLRGQCFYSTRRKAVMSSKNTCLNKCCQAGKGSTFSLSADPCTVRPMMDQQGCLCFMFSL